MKELNIDLGSTPKEMGEVPMSVSAKKTYYPSFTFSTDEAYDFPKSGKMVIEFEKVRSETSKGEGDKERHSCTIDVKSIKSISGKADSEDEAPSKNSQKDSGDALDALREKAIKKKKGEADDSEDEGY